MEVVGEEADAHPEGDHGDQGTEVVGRELALIDEAQAVDGEGARGDGHDAGGQAVEAVDEVHGVGDHDDPQRREQRRPRSRGQDQEPDEGILNCSMVTPRNTRTMAASTSPAILAGADTSLTSSARPTAKITAPPSTTPRGSDDP
jgi:hypothetical protein